jgi:hypothetical protein
MYKLQFLVFMQQQQAKKVTGCVKDALGEPIIGANA